MFADIAKMAAKLALIGVVTAAVLAVFTVIQIPEPDLTQFIQAIGMGKAFIQYWVPGYNVVIVFAGVIFTAQLSILVLRTVLVAYRWIFKVNE